MKIGEEEEEEKLIGGRRAVGASTIGASQLVADSQQQSQSEQPQSEQPQSVVQSTAQPETFDVDTSSASFTDSENEEENEEEKLEEEEDDLSAGEAVLDVVVAPLRGVAAAGEGIVGLADHARVALGGLGGGDELGDWYVREEDGIYKSKTVVGSFLESISQFAVGFGAPMVAVKGANLAFNVAKIGQRAGKAVNSAVNAASKGANVSGKTLKSVSKLKEKTRKYVELGARSALSDFIAFKGNEARLSNLLKDSAGMEGQALVEWLAYDPDKNDSELEGRFKNAVEGLLIGELAAGLFYGSKKAISLMDFKKKVPEADSAVSGVVKSMKVIKEKNRIIGEARDKGEPIDEPSAVQQALEGFEPTLEETRGMSELKQRVLDQNKAKEAEATGDRIEESPSLEEIKEEIASGDEDYTQLEFNFAKIDAEEATEKELDTWLRENADIPAGTVSREKKKALVTEMQDDMRAGAGGIEAQREALGNKIIKRMKEAGVGDDTNPISFLGGLRNMTEAPEFRTFISRISREIIKKNKDSFDLESSAKLYTETEEAMKRGVEAAGGNPKGITLEILRGRTEDLRMIRTEAEVLYTALEKARMHMYENFQNADKVFQTGELLDVELEGLGKVTLDQQRAMVELENSTQTFALFQEMWGDFGTGLSHAMRDRETLYKGGSIGREVSGQNRTIRVALAEANSTVAKLMRRNRFKNYSDKKVLADYKKLFKKTKLDVDGDVLVSSKELMERMKTNAGSMHSISKYNQVMSKGLAVSQEWYINAILQAPTSWVANVLGGALVLPLRQMETIVGAALTGQTNVAKAHLRTFFDLQSFGDALKFAWRSGKDDSARSVQGFTAFRDDRVLQAGGEIRMNNLEGNTLKGAVNFVGHGVRMPSRIMMMGDEFFKQMSFRARTKTSLALEGYKRGLNKEPNKLAEFIENGYRELITTDGRFRNEENVKREAYIDLSKRRKNGEKIVDQRAFIDEYMKDHFSGNNLRMDDGIISNTLSPSEREELVAAGTDWALVNTFTNQVENKFFKLTGKLATASPWMTFVIPFVRTPSNILLFALGRVSPLGASKSLMQERRILNEIRGSSFDEIAESAGYSMPKSKEQALRELSLIEGESQIKTAEAAGRLATGVMAMGTMLMKIEAIKDRVTGAEPEDEGQKGIWRNTGKMPYSIEFDGKWYSYQRLDPFATILGIMADFVHLHDEAKQKSEIDSPHGVSQQYEEQEPYFRTLFGVVATTMARNVSNKSYIENMGELLEILERPSEAAPNIGSNILSSFVPNAVNWSQNVFEEEPALLEARGLFDKIKKRLPENLRQGKPLMPRRDFMGKTLRKDSSSTGSLLKAINPIFASPASTSPVALEMAQIGTGRVIPPHVRKINGRKVDLRKVYNKEGTQTAFDRFMELSGTVKRGANNDTLEKALELLMESNDYYLMPEVNGSNRGSDHPKSKAISKVLSDYRSYAFDQMLSEFRDYL